MVDIGTALATCKVSNGEIHFEMNLSNDDLKDIYEILRVAIQDGQLPHYKVIGISYTAGGSTAEDYVSKLRGANRSYIETYVQLQQVIFGEVKGECTYAKTLPIWRLVSNDKDIRSDNASLLWAGSAESVRDSLICDIPILKTKNTGYILSLLVTMGTGFEDFDSYASELAQYNRENKVQYAPVAQYFNLSSYLVIRRYHEGDERLRFTYKVDVNEAVLTQILNTYGRQLNGTY